MRPYKNTFETNTVALYLRSFLIAISATSLLCLILLLLTSAILLISGKLPTDALPWIVLVLSSVSVFIGGYILSRLIGSNGLISGAALGTIMFLILLISGLIYGTDGFTMLTLVRLIAFIFTGAAGGVKGVNKKPKIKF